MASSHEHRFGSLSLSLTLVGPLAWACSAADPGPALIEQRSPLKDETQPSALLGFSLADVLPLGSQAATLTWKEAQSGIDFSPKQTTAALRWSLVLPAQAADNFRIEDVDVECDTTRFITNDATLCDDRLEATLRLHLDSDDGALAAVFPVTFVARSPTDLRWSNGDLELDQLAGTFVISASEGDPSTLRLGVFGSALDGLVTGSLIGDVILSTKHIQGGELTEGAIVTVAEWEAPPPAP